MQDTFAKSGFSSALQPGTGQRVLVTGANGFIAAHVVERLLARGYQVVGTVRDASNAAHHQHLTALPGAADRLTLVSADLTAADPFSAHADVDAIIHMASPYVLNVGDPQRDLVDPAVKGTLSLLEAALQHPRVKRVVLTSSVAAITDAPDGRVLTESDWNRQSSLIRNPYYYSKTCAERAAWDFMDGRDPEFDLLVLNPFMVIGPSHSAAVNTSNQVLADIVNGKYPMSMALTWGIVDVRDVADAHIAALENNAICGRFIVASETMPMSEMVAQMRSAGFSTGRLPKLDMSGPVGTAILRLASRFQPTGTRSYLQTHLGQVPAFDNGKSRRELGMNYRSARAAVADTLQDLVRWGHIPAPRDLS
ncbi:MAG: aldehyde reductase [Phyllobacteriaceae bacterium]|nr:aldehyde reductase [Phyllobacteriaceae bacterium]